MPFLGMSALEYQLRVVLESERQMRALTKTRTMLENVRAREAFERFVGEVAGAQEVRIELPPDAPVPELPEDLVAQLPIVWSQDPQPLGARLQKLLLEADGEPVIAFAADGIIDLRVFEQLLWDDAGSVFIHGEGARRAALLRLDAPLAAAAVECNDFLAIADEALATGTSSGPVPAFDEAAFDTWIQKLRRHLPPYVLRLCDDARRREVEHYLFRSNYKGATDFLTAHVYPPLVWALVKPLAHWRVHPNAVTAVGIAATFAAIPFFAAGWWVPGLVLAYLMSVLDSVDGKLARLTFQSSEQGDTLDHGLDIIHPPLWYFAWAWGLSGGDMTSNLVAGSGWFFLFYMLDRVMEVLFKSSTGESIHGYRELDRRMRTFISRRNVNLAIFTVALPLGLGVEAFYLMVAWQGACLLFHLWRVVKFWNVAKEAEAA